jgi:hypothetical protein
VRKKRHERKKETKKKGNKVRNRVEEKGKEKNVKMRGFLHTRLRSADSILNPFSMSTNAEESISNPNPRCSCLERGNFLGICTDQASAGGLRLVSITCRQKVLRMKHSAHVMVVCLRNQGYQDGELGRCQVHMLRHRLRSHRYLTIQCLFEQKAWPCMMNNQNFLF